mgnify:CR=1 FL=1
MGVRRKPAGADARVLNLGETDTAEDYGPTRRRQTTAFLPADVATDEAYAKQVEYVTESEKICGGGVYQHNSAGCADDAGAYAEMEEENARSREAERLRTSNEASALARMRAARDRRCHRFALCGQKCLAWRACLSYRDGFALRTRPSGR